jgi:hypothetical protein
MGLEPHVKEQELILFSNIKRFNSIIDSCYLFCIKGRPIKGSTSTIHMESTENPLTVKQIKCIDSCILKYEKVSEMVEELSKERMSKM